MNALVLMKKYHIKVMKEKQCFQNNIDFMYGSLQEKSKLETDNSVSNPSGNGIPDGLETEFSVFKTLVSNCVRLNSVSDQRPNRDGINSVSDQRPN